MSMPVMLSPFFYWGLFYLTEHFSETDLLVQASAANCAQNVLRNLNIKHDKITILNNTPVSQQVCHIISFLELTL